MRELGVVDIMLIVIGIICFISYCGCYLVDLIVIKHNKKSKGED